MKKLVKIISLMLIIIVSIALSITLVACDKDTYETVSLTEEEIIDILDSVAEDTANVENFEIVIDDGEEKGDFKVMAVDNKSALLGTLDGTEIFVGKLSYGDGTYAMNAGFYAKVDGVWEESYEFEGETATIIDLGCYEAVSRIEDILSIIDDIDAELIGTKQIKNGTLQYYTINFKYEDATFELVTTEYNGKQLIKSIVFTQATTQTFEYVYGVTFEIPEM